MNENAGDENVKKNMNTLAQYEYETWMCTGCGMKNAILDPFCMDCEQVRPKRVRPKNRMNGVKKQKAQQIQNNVNYNFKEFEPDPVVIYQQRPQSDLEKSLLFGANLVTYVCLWIVALAAIFITSLVGLGLYKAFF